MDKSKGIDLDNLGLLQTFLGGKDEAWFILVHIEIEAKAIAAIQTLRPAQQAAAENKPEHLLNRMTEHCDPYIYFNRVRPYIHGWKCNSSLPEGLISFRPI